jgi:tripartite-type tricarboxylate transporter receptor subunit TctC
MAALPHTLARCALLASVLLAGTALAADWPTRPLRFIVPATAGGGTDLIARVIAVKVADGLKQPVVVENKPGADELIGEDFVAKSAPDGYTVLISAANVAVNPAIRSKLPFDALKDLQPVAQIATLPYLIVTNPKLPAKTIPDLVAYSQTKTTGMNAAVGGTSNRLVTELFRLKSGANLVMVPYKGCGPAGLSVVTGETDVAFCSAPSLAGFVKDGRLVALALTGDVRLPMMPDVPTTKDLGLPQFHIDLSQWVGAFVAANTPPDITARLNAEINQALQDKGVQAKIAQLGAAPASMTVAEYSEFYRAELARIKDVVVRAKIPLED